MRREGVAFNQLRTMSMTGERRFVRFINNVWGHISGGPRWSAFAMPEKIELKVHLAFDDEAQVWYIAESDIPGLSLEGATPADLVNRIQEAAPELIELNIEEIIRAKGIDLPRAERHQEREQRPSMQWRPVFDSGMDLARA